MFKDGVNLQEIEDKYFQNHQGCTLFPKAFRDPKVPKHTETYKIRQKPESTNKHINPQKINTSPLHKLEVLFFDFGISLLKREHSFPDINVEDLSDREKTFLKNLLVSLRTQREGTQTAEFLRKIVATPSHSLKEYLRSLGLFGEYLVKANESFGSTDVEFGVANILYKVRSMISFLKDKYFVQEGD